MLNNTSNVLIDLGRTPSATLVDFGMANLEGKFYAVVDQRYPTPPEARGALGTGGLERLEWTAPEARSGKGWTAASDVYSLTLLLYRLLTGKRPTRGNAAEVIDPRDVCDCPSDLAMALLAGLQADPAVRLNAAQLRDRLAEVADSLSGSVESEGGSGYMQAQEADDATQAPPREPTAPAFAPPAERRPTGRPFVAWAVSAMAAVTVVALVGWWTQATEAPTAEVTIPSTLATAPAPAAASARSDDAEPAKVFAPVPVGSAAERLAAASPALTGCAHKAGRKLWVELWTAKGEPRFMRLDIIGDDREGCARRVLEQIRFDPPDSAEALVKEYGP